MGKIDAVVRRETLYVAVWTLILSALMESVLLAAGMWSLAVLLGNLLGIFASVLNFFLLGLTVQKAVSKTEKQAREIVKLSMVLRGLLLAAAVVLGIFFSWIDIITLLITILFPSAAVKLRPMFMKNAKSGAQSSDEQ